MRKGTLVLAAAISLAAVVPLPAAATMHDPGLALARPKGTTWANGKGVVCTMTPRGRAPVQDGWAWSVRCQSRHARASATMSKTGRVTYCVKKRKCLRPMGKVSYTGSMGAVFGNIFVSSLAPKYGGLPQGVSVGYGGFGPENSQFSINRNRLFVPLY